MIGLKQVTREIDRGSLWRAPAADDRAIEGELDRAMSLHSRLSAILAVGAMLCALLGGLGDGTAVAAQVTEPPKTPVRVAHDTIHGVSVEDPYRWLEDLDSPEVVTWLRAQNAYARAVLERIPSRRDVAAEVRALYESVEGLGALQRSGDIYFYLKQAAGDQVAKLYVREGLGGRDRLLLDPSKLGPGDRRRTIEIYHVSFDARHILYGVAEEGAEVLTIGVVETSTGGLLDDAVSQGFFDADWLPDGRGFAYTRLRDLPPDASPRELELCPTTYVHILGTDARLDQTLVGCNVSNRIPVEEHHLPRVVFPPASNYALAVVDRFDNTLGLYAAPVSSLAGPRTPWRKVAGPEDKVSHAVLRGDDLYVITHRGAPRSKVVRTSVSQPDFDRAEIVVPETEAVIPQRGLHLAQDGLYLQLLVGSFMRLFRLPFDESPVVEVPLPQEGTIVDIASDPRAPGLVFALESPTLSRRYYKYDPDAGRVRDIGLIAAGAEEPYDFAYDLVEVRSRDGTLVPLSILSRPHLERDGARPTLLEGYGAYGALPRSAVPAIRPLLDRRGVYAYCHTRGGGELGEEWHRGGQKGNKPNTIADYIACAEYLVVRNYTSPQNLVGLGASAGGITVGNALAQRPDLFAAVILMVPVADMLRFEFERNGPRNVPEFGSVETLGGLRALRAVSPYHQVKDGTAYPAVLITTGVNDRRVSPAQPAKLTARLQAATSSSDPVLLRVGWRTGHALGTTVSDKVEALADVISFLFWQVGHEDFRP